MINNEEKAEMIKDIEKGLVSISQRALSFLENLSYMNDEDQFCSMYINTIDSELNKIRDKFAVLKYNSRKK